MFLYKVIKSSCRILYFFSLFIEMLDASNWCINYQTWTENNFFEETAFVVDYSSVGSRGIFQSAVRRGNSLSWRVYCGNCQGNRSFEGLFYGFIIGNFRLNRIFCIINMSFWSSSVQSNQNRNQVPVKSLREGKIHLT